MEKFAAIVLLLNFSMAMSDREKRESEEER